MLTEEIAEKKVVVDVGDSFAIHADKIDSLSRKLYIEFNILEHRSCGQVWFFKFSEYENDAALLSGMQSCFTAHNPGSKAPSYLIYLF